MYSEADVTPWSFWSHRKGGTYLVLGVAVCSTNGPDDGKKKVVVYYSVEFQGMRYRDLGEFLDGRFTPIALPELPPTAGPSISALDRLD